MYEISEQKAIQDGWDNFAQQEYFTNLEKYEDMSFAGRNQIDIQSEIDNLSHFQGMLLIY
jgi:hypothetical protein